MATCTIAEAKIGGRVLLCIPDRIRQDPGEAWVTLEEIAGEEWLVRLLSRFMPKERAWAWWTRNQVFKNSKLIAARAPARLEPASLKIPVRRNLLLRQMSLLILPANDAAAQHAMLAWAGADTEQVPDHLWTAPDEPQEWDLEQVVEWCADADRWKDPAKAAEQPAERIVTLFDGHLYCVLGPVAAEQAHGVIQELARDWQLEVRAGKAEDAWAGT